jgi:hypothetical protein
MAQRSKPSGKNEQSEYAVFESALKKVLSVPHSEIKNRLKAAKQERKLRRAKRASARASRA